MRARGVVSLVVLDIDGVVTDGRVLVSAAGDEMKFISYVDMDAIAAARRRGISLALVTGEATPWASWIGGRLGIDRLVVGAKDKLPTLRSLAAEMGVGLDRVCFMGDGDRDASALAAVGLGVAPSNATRAAKRAAAVVLHSPGGGGAIHELFERLDRGPGVPRRRGGGRPRRR